MNLCAKFSKFLFSSDESNLLYPNPCVALNRKTDSAKIKDGQKMDKHDSMF